MADKRFFKLAGPFTLKELAEATGTVLSDKKYADRTVYDVSPLDKADHDELSFFDNKKYLDSFKATRAGACFVKPEVYNFHPKETACLIGKNPYKAYALAAQMFYPEENSADKISDNAVIDSTAKIGTNCIVEAGVVIGANVSIGNNCFIGANTVICDSVEIGDNCNISSQVYITHALIGSKVRIHPGVKIGSPGFGFAIDMQEGFVSVPQLGRVIIEDNVDIGANTTIDRGAGPDTIIGTGTRIDNLVQIGHNVKIGKQCILVSQSGISGSTQVGDYVVIGGQVGIAGHLKIGSGARIAAKSGIMRDIPDGNKEYMGTPAVPIKEHMRQIVATAKLASKKRSNETNG